MLSDRVAVITGCGGMGVAVTRQIGSGTNVVLADVNELALATAAGDLRAEGFEITECPVDVADRASVDHLAKVASELGAVVAVVHTAGLSPVQATANRLVIVDVVGTAHVLDVFGRAICPGGAGVFIASMAGTLSPLEPDFERRLAITPTEELLSLPELSELTHAGVAYGIAKRANQLRVRAAASLWGERGGRVNSISPGIISTKMGIAELASPTGDIMQKMIDDSAAKRIGTPADIAAATEFLLSERASFITGTDLLVDGGACAAIMGSPG